MAPQSSDHGKLATGLHAAQGKQDKRFKVSGISEMGASSTDTTILHFSANPHYDVQAGAGASGIFAQV
jgi:hypothetical protein